MRCLSVKGGAGMDSEGDTTPLFDALVYAVCDCGRPATTWLDGDVPWCGVFDADPAHDRAADAFDGDDPYRRLSSSD